MSLIALGEMGRAKPSELLVNAAVRGRFCELVGDDQGLAKRRPELFLLGTLSLVDAMLDQPMASVVEELPLADDLKQALLGHQNQFRPVLDFVEGYERADWAACTALGRENGIADAKGPERYEEALSFAADTLGT